MNSLLISIQNQEFENFNFRISRFYKGGENTIERSKLFVGIALK